MIDRRPPAARPALAVAQSGTDHASGRDDRRGDANEPFEVARARPRRHASACSPTRSPSRRLQPGVRRVGLPARPRAHRRRRPRGVVPAAPAAGAVVRRHPAAAVRCSPGWSRGSTTRTTFSGVVPAVGRRGTTVRADFRVVQDEFQSTTPPVLYSGGLGVPRRGDDGRRRVAGRHVRLPRPGTRRGARARRRALRVHRRARRRREPCRVQPARDRRRLRRPRRCCACALDAPAAHRARHDRHPLLG